MSCSLKEKRHFLVIIISVRFWSTQFQLFQLFYLFQLFNLFHLFQLFNLFKLCCYFFCGVVELWSCGVVNLFLQQK